ncbi:MAG: hypothetical protein JNK65_01815, partial [Deltaproteobacteria bacterium]|nr:hypothetical protein [Deltaproteobacteria bacterium]
MASSKKTTKPIKNKIKDTPPAERYAGIIAEDFSSKLDTVIEGMKALDTKMERLNQETRRDMNEQFA